MINQSVRSGQSSPDQLSPQDDQVQIIVTPDLSTGRLGNGTHSLAHSLTHSLLTY